MPSRPPMAPLAVKRRLFDGESKGWSGPEPEPNAPSGCGLASRLKRPARFVPALPTQPGLIQHKMCKPPFDTLASGRTGVGAGEARERAPVWPRAREKADDNHAIRHKGSASALAQRLHHLARLRIDDGVRAIGIRTGNRAQDSRHRGSRLRGA